MKRALVARRTFLAAAGASLALQSVTARASAPASQAPVQGLPILSGASPQMLPPLPYPENALEPAISAESIALHHGKHHRTYFDNLAKLTTDTPFAGRSLEELILATHGDSQSEAIYNNAAQGWNHNVYWRSLSPSNTHPSASLARAITRDFGSIDALLSQLAIVSAAQFGSGWGWLVADGGRLSVIKTSNADTPLTRELTPLLNVDVWEHAYYLQYQNRRPEYLGNVIGKLTNWDFASDNFSRSNQR